MESRGRMMSDKLKAVQDVEFALQALVKQKGKSDAPVTRAYADHIP